LFNLRLGLMLLPGFLGLFLLTGVMALLVTRRNHEPADARIEAEAPKNPLELSAALFFAISFLLVTAVTHFILAQYPGGGLRWLAFFTGFTDIDPFVLALVSGQFSHSLNDIGQAILIAAASNNLLKAVYVFAWAATGTQLTAGLTLMVLAGFTLVYGLWGFV
jgi:uncharacterized membrane protein (DUF4010 family)